MKYLAFPFILLASVAQAQQVPYPAPMSLPTNNTELKAIDGGINLRAARLGFTTAGDGGYAEYNWSGTNCSTADDGAQVQPSSTGCWIADFSGMLPTPKVWGAIGNGTTDDTVAVQKAINARAGNTLALGPNKYCIGTPGLVVSKAMSIIGETPGWPWDTTKPNYGFKACATNLNILTFTSSGADISSGSKLSGVFFDAGAAGVNSSGAAITATGTSFLRIEHVAINKACIGIDERISNNDLITQVMIRGGDATLAAGCGGIRIGAQSIGAQLTDLRLDAVTVDVHGDYAVWVQDAGGLQIHNGDFLFANNGLLIKPGTNQSVLWLFASDSALGDTTCTSGILIDTAVAASVVSGLVFNGTWSASARSDSGCLGAGVQIQNSGGGYMRGIHFNGHRSYNNGREGFIINSTNAFDISIDNSMICNNSVATAALYAGIAVGTDVRGISIRNNKISPHCMLSDFTTTQDSAIYLYGNNYSLMITGNNLQDSVNPLGGSPPTGFAIIKDNLGTQDRITNVAASGTIATELYAAVALTGTTASITNITGMWYGREVAFYARDAAQNFAVGTGVGKVCNARAVPAGGLVRALSVSGIDCVYISSP